MAGLTQKNNSSYLAKSSLLVPARKDQSELLDEWHGSVPELQATLNELWLINQVFGNLGSLIHHLNIGLANKTRAIRIADLGTGSGKLALYLRNWANRKQLELELYPVDFSRRVLSLAQGNIKTTDEIHLIEADASNLPFAPQSIDFYISSLFMHHFSPETLVELLGNAYEHAARGIIMADIVRGVLPFIGFHLIRPIFARQFLTWRDGLTSIQRAYIPEELKAICQAANIKNATIYSHFPWRMTLVAYKPHV